MTLFQPDVAKSDALDDKKVLEKVQNVAKKYGIATGEKDIGKIINSLLEAREKARSKKDWNTADGIRKDLDEIGFEIQDTDSGPVWRKK